MEIVTDEVLSICKEKYDSSKAVQIISLTQNDNQFYCTCDKCKALDDANGSHAGTMITFANKVAKSVREAGYDNIAIDTFAYQYTRKAPTNVEPEENVIVRICSIECCFGHTLNDEKCSQNKEFMQDLFNWGKICNRIYVWDYANNYAHTMNIFPDFGVLQQNIQTFYENNAKGVYEEGNYYIDSCDGEFGELRSYLCSKLMQNPYLDYDEEMNGFLKAYYGDGWESIREFIDISTENSVSRFRHMGIIQHPGDTLPKMSLSEVKRCDALWENAINLANGVQKENVLRSEICWRVWKCVNHRSEFSLLKTPLRRIKEREKLYNDIIAMGTVKMNEGSGYITELPAQYLLNDCDKWSASDETWFITKINPLVVAIYQWLKNIPC